MPPEMVPILRRWATSLLVGFALSLLFAVSQFRPAPLSAPQSPSRQGLAFSQQVIMVGGDAGKPIGVAAGPVDDDGIGSGARAEPHQRPLLAGGKVARSAAGHLRGGQVPGRDADPGAQAAAVGGVAPAGRIGDRYASRIEVYDRRSAKYRHGPDRR